MIQRKQKIIFIGTSAFALPALENLVQEYQILSVITAPDKPAGRKNEITPSPVKEIALKYNLSLLQPEKIIQVKKQMAQLEPDLIIVASYGQIIPKDILDIPKKGSLNLHPSLLPKYRGPSPIQTAILNGDQTTGLTIIQMNEKMDAGPIIVQKQTKINPNDTFQTLETRLAEEISDLLIEILPRYFKNKIQAQVQDESKASYTKILTRDHGKINLDQDPHKIERKVRAFYPWPGAWTEINGKRVKILKVKIVNGQLSLELVQPAGKKPMTGQEFSRGHKNKIKERP